MNQKFTIDKYSFGVSKEFEFIVSMDVDFQLNSENLNDTNKF